MLATSQRFSLWVGATLLMPLTAMAQTGTSPTSATPEQAQGPEPSTQQGPEMPQPSTPPSELRLESSKAFPETSAPFGSKGQWVLMGSSNSFDISNRTYSDSDARFFDVSGEIGIDSFAMRNLSLGLDLYASYGDHQGYGATTLTDTKSTTVSGGVRFGFNVPLSDLVSWYPRLTLGFSWIHSDTIAISAANTRLVPPSSESGVGPWLNFYAPLLVHPVPHFFVGFGPRIQHHFAVLRGGPYDGSQSTLLGGELVVGGWWGGPPLEGTAPAATPIEHPFGEEGHLVLTLATSASLSSFSYSKSQGSRTSVDLTPSFDYFLRGNVSVGVDAFVNYTSGTSVDSTRALTDFTSTSIGLAPRFGVNFALAGPLSLWPQVELGYGVVDSSFTSPLGTNEHSSKRSWVKIFVPLLAHAASHLFVGVGPYVFHELSNTDQYHHENDATSVGASFLLGGWL